MNKTKSIPQLEYKKSNKKEIIWCIICLVAYIVIKHTPILRLLFPTNNSVTISLFISLIPDLVILCMAFFIFKDILKRDLKVFKENSKQYIKYLCPRFIIFIVIYIIVSAICTMLLANGQKSENQEILELLPIWFLIADGAIIGPILEEFIFRGIFRRFLSNKIVFILFSAIIFGIVHVVFEENLKTAIIQMVPYSVMGGFFAYIYASTDNLTTNMLCHITYNALCVFFGIIS